MKRGIWKMCGLIGLLLIGTQANAEDERVRRAREEVERELQALTQIPPARIAVQLVPLDEPNLKCVGVELLLNGRVLPAPTDVDLNGLQPVFLYRGELSKGRHELISRVEYQDTSSVMFSESAGVKWKVSSTTRFETQDGLEIVLKVVPQRNPGERDLRKAIGVKHQPQVNMVATVDTSMPPPPEPKRQEPIEPEAVAPVALAQREPTDRVAASAASSTPSQPPAQKAHRDPGAPARQNDVRVARNTEVRSQTRQVNAGADELKVPVHPVAAHIDDEQSPARQATAPIDETKNTPVHHEASAVPTEARAESAPVAPLLGGGLIALVVMVGAVVVVRRRR